MHQLMAATLDEVAAEIARDPAAGRASAGEPERPRWPMIVLRTPKGWTGPKVVDGLHGGGLLPLAPGPASGPASNARAPAPSSRSGCAPTGPRSCSTSEGALRGGARRAGARGRPAHGRQPPRQRRRCCCATSSCPTSASYAVEVPRPGRPSSSEATRVLGELPARGHPAEPGQLPPDGSGRDRVQPPRRRLRGRPTALGGRDAADDDDHLAPDGRVMEVLSEHLCQGWLEGYLLTGRHGLFNCYEAFIHIIDSMFNQHAKWLKVTRDIPWRRPDRLAELPALLARLAPGPQRLLPPGPRLHRPCRQQEGRDRPRLPAAGRQLPAVGRRPLSAQPQLRQRDRRRQAAGAGLPGHGRGGRPLHARHRRLGLGEQRRGQSSPTSCSPAPATCRRSRRSPRPRSCASELPELKVRVVNVVDLMRLQPDTRAPARSLRPRVRRPVHHRPARDLRLPRLPVADPPAHLPPPQPPQHPRPRLQGGGHDHHARSTWSCSTTSTASTS